MRYEAAETLAGETACPTWPARLKKLLGGGFLAVGVGFLGQEFSVVGADCGVDFLL